MGKEGIVFHKPWNAGYFLHELGKSACICEQGDKSQTQIKLVK